ncbi:MAG: hypothetical protein JKY56_25725 [Kofleriaceae bacterium]|nr:hypothetical protein [Kofleriaceae bacterium]
MDERGRDNDIEARVDASGPADANSFFSCGPNIHGVIGLFSLTTDDGAVMGNSIAGPDGKFFDTAGMTTSPMVVDMEICGPALALGSQAASFAELDSDAFTDARSVDFWFQPGTVQAEAYAIEGLLTKDTLLGMDGDFGLYIVRNTDNEYQLVAQRQVGSELNVNCSAPGITRAEWHHVAVSFTDTGVDTVFLDGAKLAGTILSPDAPVVGDIACASSQLVGVRPTENSQPWHWGSGPSITDSEKNTNFSGLIDELRFRDAEMSEGQALNFYETGISGLSNR